MQTVRVGGASLVHFQPPNISGLQAGFCLLVGCQIPEKFRLTIILGEFGPQHIPLQVDLLRKPEIQSFQFMVETSP